MDEFDWEEYMKERERRPEKMMKLISDIIFSHQRFCVTHEECDILAREIFEKLKEEGFGSEPPIA